MNSGRFDSENFQKPMVTKLFTLWLRIRFPILKLTIQVMLIKTYSFINNPSNSCNLASLS